MDSRPLRLLVSTAKAVLPPRVRRWLRAGYRQVTQWPPWVRFGSLRRVTPLSRDFARGQPIDRHYIEAFLARYASDIHGRVLEVGDDTYTRQFGGQRVIQSEVLHATSGNPQATIVADLAHADQIPPETFDCIIMTQTLQYIYDARAAIRTLHRILKPGGVVLATFPGISQISRYDMDRWGEYWRFTTLSAKRLFEEIFPEAHVRVEAHGNVLAAIAFLHGLGAQELRQEELDSRDPEYEVSITVRAVKPGRPTARLPGA